MRQYTILDMHYPFDIKLAVVDARNAQEALKQGREKYRRPVVIQPVVKEPEPRAIAE